MNRAVGLGMVTGLVLLVVTLPSGCRQRTVQPAEQASGPGGVTLGMTSSQVQQVMLDEVQQLQMAGLVRNPYSKEVHRSADGTVTEVWFYYLGPKRGDNRISDDELVPIIFQEGQVVGWGWEEFMRLSITP